jgi:hypothetical protein
MVIIVGCNLWQRYKNPGKSKFFSFSCCGKRKSCTFAASKTNHSINNLKEGSVLK